MLWLKIPDSVATNTAGKCPDVSWNISSGFKLTYVETRCWTVVCGFPVFRFNSSSRHKDHIKGCPHTFGHIRVIYLSTSICCTCEAIFHEYRCWNVLRLQVIWSTSAAFSANHQEKRSISKSLYWPHEVEVICFQYRMDGNISSTATNGHKYLVLTRQLAGRMRLPSQVLQSRFICRVNEKFSGSLLQQNKPYRTAGSGGPRGFSSDVVFVTNESGVSFQ